MDAPCAPMLDFNEDFENTGLKQEPSECIQISSGVQHSENREPDIMEVVVAFWSQTEQFGDAAEFPGEAGVAVKDEGFVGCICCGKAEIQKKTLICDACGKSYHLKCTKLRENQVCDFDEWVCAECAVKQEKHRWALGRIDPGQLTKIFSCNDRVQETWDRNGHCLLDRELKPETDRASVTKQVTPVHGEQLKKAKDDDFDPGTAGSKKSFGSSRGEPKSRTTRLKTIHRSKHSGHVTVHRHGIEGEDEIGNESSDSSGTSITASSKDVDDEVESSAKELNVGIIGQQHLKKLKEFIMQKGGTIDEDWRVEVKKRIHSEKTFDITFFSSDGQKFRSKLEVARYLGLLEQKLDANSRDLSTPASRRKRKEAFKEPEHSLEDTEQNDEHIVESVKRQKTESCSQSESQDLVVDIGLELPFQCMDLRIESLGTVEIRPGYYNDDFVWPIGYRCLWHDGVTGSICISEVLDGGPLHPNFRVTRKSCFSYSGIPTDDNDNINDSNSEQTNLKPEKKQVMKSDHVYDEDDELNSLVGNLLEFSEHNPAIGRDCNFWHDKYENIMHDDVGEIVVESSSSSGAWKLLADRILDSMTEVSYMGRYNIGCRHVGNRQPSPLGSSFPVSMGEFNKGELDIEKFYPKLLAWFGQDRFGFDVPIIRKYFESEKAKLLSVRPSPPDGWSILKNVSAKYAGDLLQIWEFLCRFSDILGQKEPPSLEDLEDIVAGTSEIDIDISVDRKGEHLTSSEMRSRRKYFSPISCCNVALAGSNISLLKIALSDLHQVVSTVGPELSQDAKRSRKKDGEGVHPGKRQTGSLITLNELTWPEVARRYVIGLLALRTCGDNIDISVQERRKILHCIQGDGGALCGALAGVAAIEADAQLLATAEKQLSRWLHSDDQKDASESLSNDFSGGKAAEAMMLEGVPGKPSWAVVLEPVRKLATNVGARIRNCVREALEMNPPEWAKEILEWSISKEVYKGNASGPTKRAVLSVLEKVINEEPVMPPIIEKIQYVSPTAALVMRRCRAILRQIITSDDVRTFCNSLGGTVLGYFEEEEENIEMLLPLVTRPLDFRIIDSRLAAGAYGDLHESFAADMRQLFQNVSIIFHDREDMIKVGEDLSQQFERLYEERVLKLVSGKEEVRELTRESDVSTVNMKFGLDEELMKAPWEEGVCKICGIDKDDDSTLLCDRCDAEYHIYCLIPPLSMIPEGNWYCPSCVSHEKNDYSGVGTGMVQVIPGRPGMSCQQNKLVGDEAILPSLAESMSGKDYWQLSTLERVQLLKFLCDKVLESTCIRDHIDQCVESIPELQQKLRLLLMEKQTLVSKGVSRYDEILAPDNVESMSKDVFMPKKRGRKSIKANIPCPLMSDTTGSEVGMESKKMQIDYSHFHEVDGASIEEKLNGRSVSIDHTPAHARNGEAEKDIAVGASNQPGKEQIGTQFSSERAQVQNGNFHGLEGINLPGGHPMGVTDVHSPLKIDFCPSIDLTNRSNGILQDSGNKDQVEISLLSHIHKQDGHDFPRTNTSVAPVHTGLDLLEAEIYRVEAELMKMASRREFLGRDDLGRNYWALGWIGKVPWLVVEAMPSTFATHAKGDSVEATRLMAKSDTEWSAYCSEQSIEQLIKWLKPTIASEKMLKLALTKWCLSWSRKYRQEMVRQYYSKSKPLSSASLNTKAAIILSKMFGSVPQPEASNEMSVRKRGRKKKSVSEGIVRCECLELVLPTRIHCPCCHHSYETEGELVSHNNSGCSWTGLEDEGQILTMSKKKMKLKGQDFNSPDLHLVVKRFTLKTSNRERILQIGCLGDKGPRFVPALTVSPLLDPALHLASLYDNLLSDITNNSGARQGSAGDAGKGDDITQLQHRNSILSLHQFGKFDTNLGKTTRTLPPEQENSIVKSRVLDEGRERDVYTDTIRKGFTWKSPPAQSLDQSNTWAFKKLKVSLLDIESILSSDIMEPSRSEPNRRRAWRSFVKSASSVHELVQSLVLLEQMIKPNSLRETWCHWTSPSAGVGINTISSLALRIYSLDAAIKYKKLSRESTNTEDAGKPNKAMKKKKIQG